MSRLWYIRHAPTKANISGEMVKDYDSYGIIPFDNDKWWKTVGYQLPKDFKLLVSPAKRCIQTAEVLFSGKDFEVLDELREFDFSFLGDTKFWEISEEEFDKLSPLTTDLITDTLEDALIKLAVISREYENAVVIGHGFYGRCLLNYYNGNTDTPFKVLNSKNFKFTNLDMMKIERSKTVEIWRFNEKVP